MRYVSFCIVCLFIPVCTGWTQPVQLSTTFNQITSVTPLDDGNLLVTQYKGDYKAKVYNPDKDSVLNRFVPDGKGPGESIGVVAVDYDEKSDRFTFYSRDNRWIQTDTEGNTINESVTKIPEVSHICDAQDSTMQVFAEMVIPAQVMKENDPMPVSFEVSVDNLSNEDSLMVTPQQLSLDAIENIERVKLLDIDFIGHRIDEHRILLTYEGSKYLFLFEDQQLIKKVPADLPGNFGMKVTERKGKVGRQAAGVFTHLQALENGTLLFSMGNTHQDLPFGAIYVMVSDANNIVVSHEELYDGFGEVSGGYNHIFDGEDRLWFSEFYFTGYNIYKEELEL